jgi:hypothetical protein
MKPNDLIIKVMRTADTKAKGSTITATDTKRVIVETFRHLSKLDTVEYAETIARLTAMGEKAEARAKTARKKAK